MALQLSFKNLSCKNRTLQNLPTLNEFICKILFSVFNNRYDAGSNIFFVPSVKLSKLFLFCAILINLAHCRLMMRWHQRKWMDYSFTDIKLVDRWQKRKQETGSEKGTFNCTLRFTSISISFYYNNKWVSENQASSTTTFHFRDSWRGQFHIEFSSKDGPSCSSNLIGSRVSIDVSF